MKNCWYNTIISISLLIFLRCTENPFFTDHIKATDGYTLTGSVELSDDASPDNVFVWLEELNVGDFTDKDGNFVITIPHPQAQPGGGVSGECKLHYYVGNYRLTYSTILMLHGAIKYNKLDVDRHGNVKNKRLQKILGIQTFLEPAFYHADESVLLQIKFLVQIYNEPVLIRTYKWQRDKNFISNIFFRNVNEPVDSALQYQRSLLLREEWLAQTERNWHFEEWSDSLMLAPGIYEVVPYLEVMQDDVPEELICAAGGDPDFINNKWLNLPYKRTINIIEVLE
jgi:hypothetical protein